MERIRAVQGSTVRMISVSGGSAQPIKSITTGGGTKDYNNLTNRPTIDGVTAIAINSAFI